MSRDLLASLVLFPLPYKTLALGRIYSIGV